MAELSSLRGSARIWSLRRRESPFFLDFLCHPERSEGSRAGFLLLPAVYVGEGLAPPASFPVMSVGAAGSRPPSERAGTSEGEGLSRKVYSFLTPFLF